MRKFSKSDLDRLFKEMNYLNIEEYQGFCDKHRIPYHIYAEVSGRPKKTGAKDRKKIVLARIRHFLKTGKSPRPTIFAKDVVNFEKLKNIAPSTRLHFGQYDKKNAGLFRVMRNLTDGKFRNGAIARIVMNDFWTRGIAPTLQQFAKAWLASDAGYLENHPEAAYLTDRRMKGANSGWKNLRIKKAKSVLSVLNRL